MALIVPVNIRRLFALREGMEHIVSPQRSSCAFLGDQGKQSKATGMPTRANKGHFVLIALT
jgi:hypothetical protein